METVMESRTEATPARARRSSRLEAALDGLEKELAGSLLRPEDDDYELARRVFNAAIDRRPAAIVRAAATSDVARAVELARAHDLPVAVRGGGHSVGGKSVADAALLIDLSAMKAVRVDPQRRSARAGPGVRLGELDRATQAYGLATPLGTVSDTGIAGLTLGGGIGWLNGKHGLSCDNLLGVELVTADARVLRASPDENEDLFWGVRGGGGNFGIATSFEYRLHPVGPVLAGPVFYPLSCARDVLRSVQELSAGCPDDLSTEVLFLTLPDGTPVVAAAACWAGDPAEGETVVAPFRKLGPPVSDGLKVMPYVVLQSLLDDCFPRGRYHYWKSAFTAGLGEEGIRVFADSVARKPSPFTIAYLEQLHGAAARVPAEATAFPHRGDRWDLAILSQWADPREAQANAAFTRELFEAMRPHLDEAVYVNNLGEEGDERVRAAYGANHARLAALKRQVDPANFFRGNQNVRPEA
jgi:FAD/FMN-containing dehydrogenase